MALMMDIKAFIGQVEFDVLAQRRKERLMTTGT